MIINTLQYKLTVPRSKKKRIWKKRGLSKNGRYHMGYYIKTEPSSWYKISYDITIKPPCEGRVVKIPLATNSIPPYYVNNVSCIPAKEKK